MSESESNSSYGPWVWSSEHRRHYSHVYNASGACISTIWSGPSGQNQTVLVSQTPLLTQNSDTSTPRAPTSQLQQLDSTVRLPNAEPPTQNYTTSTKSPSFPSARPLVNLQQVAQSTSPARIASLPGDVQASLNYLDRRFIQTVLDQNNAEQLDPRYRRVASHHHTYFFIPGRVFMVLWTEPAGQVNPGLTRNSTHFSTVWFGEQAYSEIRRFVVVRNKGTFSQCIPIQTYRGCGATKPGLVMRDHGIIYTTASPPDFIHGENFTKYAVRVIPTAGETLDPRSRVNYGKAYAVEHNVKVLDVGMVQETHRYLIQSYFDSAMRGQ